MPLGTSTADRRHFWRAAFSSPVRVSSGAGAWEGSLVDLSLKGALVEFSDTQPFQPGEHCQLDLVLSADAAIHMNAVVSHLADNRVGLRCDHLDLDSITHLRRLVELNAGDPELLDRELSALVQA